MREKTVEQKLPKVVSARNSLRLDSMGCQTVSAL